MGLFKNLFPKKAEADPPQEAPQPQKPKGIIKTENFKVYGMEAHMADIMELVDKNEDFKLSKKNLIEDGREDEKIYEYELSQKATLIFGGGGEIQVFVYDTLIGRIKEGKNTNRVKKLLESGKIQSVYAEVSGGKYKFLRYDSKNSEYVLDTWNTEFAISIEITFREEIKEE